MLLTSQKVRRSCVTAAGRPAGDISLIWSRTRPPQMEGPSAHPNISCSLTSIRGTAPSPPPWRVS
eukprot:2209306-Pyramimonas_sp.AAC.1